MKFLLTLHMNPTLWEALGTEDKQAVFDGHEKFIQHTTERGELVGSKALADPAASRIVRVRDGEVQVADGLYTGGDSFLCGYYVVDVESEARAVELAGLVPDARHTAVEVRPVIHEIEPR